LVFQFAVGQFVPPPPTESLFYWYDSFNDTSINHRVVANCSGVETVFDGWQDVVRVPGASRMLTIHPSNYTLKILMAAFQDGYDYVAVDELRWNLNCSEDCVEVLYKLADAGYKGRVVFWLNLSPQNISKYSTLYKACLDGYCRKLAFETYTKSTDVQITTTNIEKGYASATLQSYRDAMEAACPGSNNVTIPGFGIKNGPYGMTPYYWLDDHPNDLTSLSVLFHLVRVIEPAWNGVAYYASYLVGSNEYYTVEQFADHMFQLQTWWCTN
jgi:hypothetical protein